MQLRGSDVSCRHTPEEDIELLGYLSEPLRVRPVVNRAQCKRSWSVRKSSMFVSCLADSHLRLSWWFGLTVQGFEPLVFAEGEWEITQANRGKLKLIAQRHIFFASRLACKVELRFEITMPVLRTVLAVELHQQTLLVFPNVPQEACLLQRARAGASACHLCHQAHWLPHMSV